MLFSKIINEFQTIINLLILSELHIAQNKQLHIFD
jgi:hypothetical protein